MQYGFIAIATMAPVFIGVMIIMVIAAKKRQEAQK
jgi:hypothetical protein